MARDRGSEVGGPGRRPRRGAGTLVLAGALAGCYPVAWLPEHGHTAGDALESCRAARGTLEYSRVCQHWEYDFLRRDASTGRFPLYPDVGEPFHPPAWCLPGEIDFDTVRAAFVDYAQAHPERLEEDAVGVLEESLESAFPCS